MGRSIPRLRYVDYIETQGEPMYEHAVKSPEGVGKKADSQYILGVGAND